MNEAEAQTTTSLQPGIGQEERFRIIAENSLDAIILVDNDGIVRFVSPSIESLIGFYTSDYEGIDAFDVIHPDDQERVRQCHRDVVRTKESVDLEYRVLHTKGHTVYIESRVKAVLDCAGEVQYVVAIARDITKRKATERALEESEQRYKSLFENNLAGVFSIDLALNFVNANRAFEDISGIEMATLTDRCFMGLIWDEDHPSVYQVLFEVMQQKEPRDFDCRIYKGRHGEKIVNITMVPIILGGQLTGVHGLVRDITERKREEQELIHSEERYRSLQQSLNRFSSDLANVMKVADLEKRLLDEVRDVLQVTEASIEERPRGQEPADRDPLDHWVKIGQKEHPVYLRIALKQPISGIEAQWLETAMHYVTILYDNLLVIEDLIRQVEEMVEKNETPKWMLRLLFKLSEKERFALSSDLHDSVLQDLIIWYRKLESLRSGNGFDEPVRSELVRIEEGLLDAIHQIRITCNELRPPFLLKMGLVESVKSLLTYARMFANYEIGFTADGFDSALGEEQILGVYRIVQELLNNASKHSEATRVDMNLSSDGGRVYFSYSDDGVGIDLTTLSGSFQHMGISGMEKRVLSLGGEMKLRSSPKAGFHVQISIPENTDFKGDTYGHFVG
ncbi:PAS domain-containing sensor histidine kinase [Cohnella candidum]|uniref:histidine kinase n=1 Tax=Cohnella candidum TaxID=2674991 RepID=A0A3G3K0I7_9BACL|nr:PAS domain S-box protein [Cohnella candidum]AYQ73933.1 PAS domain S-box protein [Cohnella candidum]